MTMYKLMGEQISVTIHKLKNSRTSGNTSTVIPIEIVKPEKPHRKSKAERKQDRADAKGKRKNKRKL